MSEHDGALLDYAVAARGLEGAVSGDSASSAASVIATPRASLLLRKKAYVLPRGGIIGYRLPPLRASTLPLLPDDLLILATDGIRPGFEGIVDLAASPRQIADLILERRGQSTDDALVLVGRWRATRNASRARR